MRNGLFLHWENLQKKEKKSFLNDLEFFILRAFSLFYGLGINIRNFAYDHQIFKSARPQVPVLSVGNLSMGGTGKTPMVLALAQKLSEHGKKVVILTRGYGAKNSSKEPLALDSKDKMEPDALQYGDEPTLLALKSQGIPLVIGSNRVLSAKIAQEKFHADCLLLDDGFQHRQLHRDWDLVLLDDTILKAPLLFPAGILREGVSSLKRARMIAIHTETSLESFCQCFEKRFSFRLPSPMACFSYKVSTVQDFKTKENFSNKFLLGKKLLSFCAIAHPESFENLLKKEGAVLMESKRFLDHHHYTPQELETLVRKAREKNLTLITTEKDSVKLPQGTPAHILKIEINWKQGEREIEDSLLKSLKR